MISNYWDAKFFQEISSPLKDKLKSSITDRHKYESGAIICFEGDSIEGIGKIGLKI